MLGMDLSGDWFVVATEPRAEDAVSKRAGDLKIETYYPLSRQVVRRRGRRTTVELVARQTPAMAGYVFVQGRGHFSNFRRDFDAPDAVPHCLGWLCGSDGPERVPPAVVIEMRQREADGEFDQAEREGRYFAPRWLRARARVRIVEGALKGFVGEVWRVTSSRKVAIWTMMMGRLTLTELPIDWVARAR
jgi:transcription antitermination factor NusG